MTGIKNGIALHYDDKTRMFCISSVSSCECGNHVQRDIKYGASDYNNFEEQVKERLPGILARLKREGENEQRKRFR